MESQKKVEEGFVGQQMLVLPPDSQRKFLSNPLAKNLYPTAIGFYPHASFHDRERLTGCEQYILLYCTEGKGWLKIDDARHSITQNNFVMIPQNVPHHYGSSQKDPWSIYWIHFSGDHAHLYYSRYLENNPGKVSLVAYDENRTQVFLELFNTLTSDLNGQNVEKSYIKLVQFLGSILYVDISARLDEKDVISSSIYYMKQNITKNFKIKELALHVNYSVSHYSELFRKKTGCAPLQYFIQLKISKACQYLYFTKLSIKEICYLTGFDDPFYFSRIFKKLNGQSPVQYRKLYKSHK